MMSKRNKYKKGALITDTCLVVHYILSRQWLYWHGVPKSPLVLINMSLATLRGAARAGRIHVALLNEPRP